MFLYMKTYAQFFIKFRWVPLRMGNVSDKSCKKNQNTHFMINIFFSPKIVPFMRFIHSTGIYRMRRFLAVLRIFFHSSLLCTFPCHPSPPTILPSSLTSSCHLLLGPPLNLLFPNSYIIPFWEFYFLPFSVHAQTNVIYLTLLSLLQ